MDNILEIKNLDLFFKSDNKEYQALHNVNLILERGKIHSIVGESGCGKTMTAMSIIRLLPKNAIIKQGEILFNSEGYNPKTIKVYAAHKMTATNKK